MKLPGYIVRLQQTVQLHCSITNLQVNFAKENTEVYKPITFQEIVIVIINHYSAKARVISFNS